MSTESPSLVESTSAEDAVARPGQPAKPTPSSSPARHSDSAPEITAHTPGKVQVIRRNGKVTHFDAAKIMVAMTKAFLAVEGGSAAASSRVHDRVRELAEQVTSALTRRL
uniref:ATP cone domain-containing protein n=1 Tax=Thiocapsa sp. TaxID=2024551 RepID=UPI0035937E9E